MSKNKNKKTNVLDKIIDEVVEEVLGEEIEVNDGIVPIDIRKTMSDVREYLVKTPRGSREIDVAVYDAMEHLERVTSLIKFIESARK